MNDRKRADIRGEIILDCAFCRSAGRDPFGLLAKRSRCQVCGGSGKVRTRGPVIPCAYCSGTGVHVHRRMVCTVCSGIGVVSLFEPVETCHSCHGKGLRQGESLPCLTCGGKGVIAAKHSEFGRS